VKAVKVCLQVHLEACNCVCEHACMSCPSFMAFVYSCPHRQLS
jgi:hypothetical protein